METPQVEIGTLEHAVLERAYALIEHLQQLRASTEQEQVRHLAGLIDYDVEGLKDMLRITKEEIRDIRRLSPASRQTDSEPQQP